MHTARIMLPDSYVTKRSGFQRLQGNHADLLWAGQLADSGAAEVTCRWHRGIAAFSGVAIGFGGSDDDSDDSWSFWQEEAGVILPSLPTEQSVRTPPDELGPRKELLGETKNAQTTSF